MIGAPDKTASAAHQGAARLILLHEDDTVLVCATPIKQGEMVRIDDACVRVETAVAMGHKVARRALAPGSKVIKYGVPVGSTTRAVQVGEHVHLHNMRSDYLTAEGVQAEHSEVK